MSRRWLAILAALAIAAAVIGGLVSIGGPGQARLERLDDRRIAALRSLVGEIERHYLREDRLPGTLEALQQTGTEAGQTLDPITGEPFDYMPLGPDRYRLCARLDGPGETASDETPRRLSRESRIVGRERTSLPGGGAHLCLEVERTGPSAPLD